LPRQERQNAAVTFTAIRGIALRTFSYRPFQGLASTASPLFLPHIAGRNLMTKKYPKNLAPLLDSVSARTCRHLRLMKALFEIDDPELEQALALILERVAGVAQTSGKSVPPPAGSKVRRRRRPPQASDLSKAIMLRSD
jgi:hypothetical protein